MKSKVPVGFTKKEKLKLLLVIFTLGLIVSLSYSINGMMKKKAGENSKVAVVKGNPNTNDNTLIEYRDTFEYLPDYNDFYEVDDELDDSVTYKVSEGELRIRNYLGNKMDRAHPKLIQKVAMPLVYKNLIDDTNQNKGKVFWVSGKVLSISRGVILDAVLSAQFIFLFQIETADGGQVELQAIRSSQDIRVGDIVYMNGIFLKLKKQKKTQVVSAVLLGNSIQILLSIPTIWETKKMYDMHLQIINENNKKLMNPIKEIALSNWITKFEKELESNDKIWAQVDDKKEEESQKLVPALEMKIINGMSNVSNSVLLDLVETSLPIDQMVKDIDQHRRKIIRVIGKLESITEALLSEPTNEVNKVYYAKVKDFKGNSYYFNYLLPHFIDQNDRESWKDPTMLIPKEGDIVVCAGVLVQIVKEGENKLPLLYGKYLSDIGDYLAIWNSVDHGGKRTSATNYGDYKEAGEVEKMPLSFLLSKTSYTNSSAIRKAFEATPEVERISFEKMINDPEPITDLPFARFGTMKLIKKIEGTQYYDFHGVKDVYEIYFIDIESHIFSIICLNLPVGAEVNTRMTFTGYFLKRTAFRNTNGNITWAPYLVGYIDEVEKIVEKKMSMTEKVLFIVFSIIGLSVIFYLNMQHYQSHKRINKLRNEGVKNSKINREVVRQLTITDKKLDEILITHFHHTLVEVMPIPIELCQNVSHWPKPEDNKLNTLLRPEYLRTEYDAIIRHYSEFGTDIPKDIKAAFFNKRKELLGLRTFQISKFEIPDHEKKRNDCYLVVPLKFIVNRPESFALLDGYFDSNCLPPWNTWMYIGRIPKFVIRNPTAGFNPETIVLICVLPLWMAEKAKEQFRIIIKEKKEVVENDSNEKLTDSSNK